jgi:hypothetical protein
MHPDSKKGYSFLALLFATSDVRRFGKISAKFYKKLKDQI